ncbi:hypothetical protein HDU93_002912, partial [Gonapodya sp. JEL0774]
PSIKLTADRFREELIRVDNILFAPAQVTHRWFRPGSGWFNKEMLEVARELSYTCVLGSIFPHDPQLRSARLNAFQVLARARDGAIIIMHDGRPWTVETLAIVLPELKKRGFR